MPGQRSSRERRLAVLARAQQVGVELAAEEAGVTAETVERWAERLGVEPASDAAPEPAGPDAPAERDEEPDLALDEQLGRTARAARNAVERAIRRLDEILPSARNVQAIAVAAGVLSDKAAQLEQILREADERRTRLTEEQAGLLAAVLERFVEALGLPVSDPARRVLRALLEQAAAGDVLAVSPADAAEARAATRARIAEEFERALPAPPADAELVEGLVNG
jgi:hypothetical protein